MDPKAEEALLTPDRMRGPVNFSVGDLMITPLDITSYCLWEQSSIIGSYLEV